MPPVTRKLKNFVCKAMKACGSDSVTVPRVKILRGFLAGDVAGFVQANAHWVPTVISVAFPCKSPPYLAASASGVCEPKSECLQNLLAAALHPFHP